MSQGGMCKPSMGSVSSLAQQNNNLFNIWGPQCCPLVRRLAGCSFTYAASILAEAVVSEGLNLSTVQLVK